MGFIGFDYSSGPLVEAGSPDVPPCRFWSPLAPLWLWVRAITGGRPLFELWNSFNTLDYRLSSASEISKSLESEPEPGVCGTVYTL